MRFMVMVMVPPSAESESGPPADPEAFAKMDRFNEELVRAGVALAYDGLQPTAKGARLTYSKGTSTVVDGPFTESKELVAGYLIIKVKSKEEAISWMKRAPFIEGAVVELRQLFEMDDFAGVDPTGELRKLEIELRKIMLANAT